MTSLPLSLSVLIATVALLTACGVGSPGDLPPVREAGQVSGSLGLNFTTPATVSAYGWDGENKGVLLASTQSNESNAFEFTLRAKSQAVLLEVSDGTYLEPASGRQVRTEDGRPLRTVFWYESGAAQSVMLTPLSPLAAGLSEYRAKQGVDLKSAITQAYAATGELFQVDVAATAPIDTNSEEAVTDTLDEQHLYGFLLATLSAISAWGANEGGYEIHTTHNSYSLASLLGEDVRADGLLDGVGFGADRQTKVHLSLADTPLNSDFYRHALSMHLLAVVNSRINNTTLDQNDLLAIAKYYAELDNPLLDPVNDKGSNVLLPEITASRQGSDTTTFGLTLRIKGILPPATLAIEIDGQPAEFKLTGTPGGGITLGISTNDYGEGQHKLGIRSADSLGNEVYKEFVVDFGGLFLQVQPALTNQTEYTLRGGVDLPRAQIASVSVAGREAEIADDGSWQAQTSLSEGVNDVEVNLVTTDGYIESLLVGIGLDLSPPVFDAAIVHSKATVVGELEPQEVTLDDDNALPLLIESHKTELAGTLVTRQDLETSGIPYFAFAGYENASDPIATPSELLKAETRYGKNGTMFSEWRQLSLVEGEHLVPVATESLAPQWKTSSPQDQHEIEVRLTDLAGNSTIRRFTFKTAFQVTQLPTVDVADVTIDELLATPFADRQTLNERPVLSHRYELRNDTDNAFYIQPTDDNPGSVEQWVDTLVREHFIKEERSTQWRAGQINLPQIGVDGKCPSMPALQNVDSVQDFVGPGAADWVTLTPPAPQYVRDIQIFEDSLPANEPPSAWQPVPLEPTPQFIYDTNDDPFTFTYETSFDYRFNDGSRILPTVVTQLSIKNTQDGSVTHCDPIHAFEQRQVFQYLEQDGPQNVSDSFKETTPIAAASFTVVDLQTNEAITPIAGWYRIPAGHSVRILKNLTLPSLSFYNDLDVLDPATFSSYTTKELDNSLTWFVNRNLSLAIAHDGGEDKIHDMPTSLTSAGEGNVSYLLSR